MPFAITGLNPSKYNGLFSLSDAELESRGMRRYVSDADFGYPDRVTLTDVAPGGELILLSYEHQPADTPYKATGPIFVTHSDAGATVFHDDVPASLAQRTLSLRAYDVDDMMEDGVVVEGAALAKEIERLFDNPATAYIHAHYASRGCYAALIDRH